MSRTSRLGRWRRFGVFSVAFLAGALAVAFDAQGVILYSTPDRNITPPSVSDGLDAWDLEATWGSFLATPIDATHFIAASHVGFQSSTITLNNIDYQVDASFGVPDTGSDLSIYKLSSASAQ